MIRKSVKKLNFFLARHGVLKYCSLRMILYQENLDSKKYCIYSFREYMQIRDNQKRRNTNQARTLDCVYLRASDSK